MKKDSRPKENQYYPFDDFRQPFIAFFEDPKIDGDVPIPWKTLAKGIKDGRTMDSMALTYLVTVYQRTAETDGIDKARVEFWTLVGSWHLKAPTKAESRDYIAETPDGNFKDWLSMEQPAVRGLSFIINEMRLKLYEAKAGNRAAAQTIVKACPEAIYLPFIAKTLADIVADFKYGEAGKQDPGAWKGFLPKRPGGAVPYTDDDIKRVGKKARQQDSRPLMNESSLKGKGSLLKDIGAEMGISADKIRKVFKTQKGPGRPKNKGIKIGKLHHL
jgi:hypothetical protein